MGTIGYALAAVDADKRLPGCVEIDRIHRTGLCAGPAADAELLSHQYASALSLGIRPGRTGRNAGRGVASQTEPWLEPCREAPRRPDADTRRVPGQSLMHKPCTGERARVTSDAALHSRCGQNFHGVASFCLSRIPEIITTKDERFLLSCLSHAFAFD